MNEGTVEHDAEHGEHPPPTRRPWSPGGIAAATILLSVLPGAILHALNYGRLGRPDLTRPALIKNLIGVVLFVVCAYFLEHAVLMVTVAYAVYFYKTQSFLFDKYVARGGAKASVVLPALGWMLATVVPLVLLVVGIDYLEELDEGFNRAYRLMESRELDRAEELFLEIVEDDPTDGLAHWNLAVIHDRRGELALAIERLRILKKDAPGFRKPGFDPDVYLVELEQRRNFARGVELVKTDPTAAEAIFLEYLERGPEERNTRWNLAVIYENRGELAKAIEQIKALTAQYPDYAEAVEYLKQLESDAKDDG